MNQKYFMNLSRLGVIMGALGQLFITNFHCAGNAVPSRLSLPIRLTWGHSQSQSSPFQVSISSSSTNLTVESQKAYSLEVNDAQKDGCWHTRSGNGDVDGVEFVAKYSESPANDRIKEQSIWSELFAKSDEDTVRRLKEDPAFEKNSPKITVQLSREGMRGFSFTPSQLISNRALWIPSLDIYVTRADTPIAFEDHLASIKAYEGRSIREITDKDPEATYEQFVAHWEDMGSPAYKNPHSQGPGHIVCLTWDSAIEKYGVDRWAGVWNDYGNPNRFRLWLEFGKSGTNRDRSWKGQRLERGLPVITTVFEEDQIRYEIEQFAYPLQGPPSERLGEIPMVLLQKIKVNNISQSARDISMQLIHLRQLANTNSAVRVSANQASWFWEDDSARGILLAVQGEGLTIDNAKNLTGAWNTNRAEIRFTLPVGGEREFTIKLPSQPVGIDNRDVLARLSYLKARQDTLQFWSDYLSRGALFDVPEESVNQLFRANLWHALRLPRRHDKSPVDIDLPYSNFAYDQRGTPWPVNQAVYVDYMLYDLRGYHGLSVEELAIMYKNNQESNGHIKGYANWGVYTPSMMYVVAQNYLLSGDRAAFESLLPQTLKALDWCLAEMKRAGKTNGTGLILAPLNDLSHDMRAWSFNQAYFYAGLERLGKALVAIKHPRAEECQQAATQMHQAIESGFSRAATQSTLVQLRDHTWSPYVPGDALTPRRLLEIWYPTDIDTGPLHLTRLKALDPKGVLADYLLNDHEDNLFMKGWSMANEPVYNQHAMTYLFRDEPKQVIRAFYSMMACAFSHSVFEPVEHRWGWGQYFGPPSTDGAWFELYRNMLIHERDDDALVLLQATPRKWLEPGKQIRVEKAPTYYGLVNLRVDSRKLDDIQAIVEFSSGKRPKNLFVRLRHSEGKSIRSVKINGRDWTDFDVKKEWICIVAPSENRYEIRAGY